ncbi:NAD(P)(+) transhydrogenase (Re/Si-specific) subunit beta [Aeoliella sp.]|uniref:NAD(P)(+) transhydrogenase (Re/Si-specific) subunit beta n=1 Tax=Aeoliella sp. TaxID=2795800 RepID=UPI003CCBC14B
MLSSFDISIYLNRPEVADAGYLLAAVLFILGIKGMTHPRTAVRGNLLGAMGMLVAVLVTVVKLELMPIGLAGGAMAVGAAIGYVLAVRVQMTEMPQLVALFNGFGGAASLLVAGAEIAQRTSVDVKSVAEETQQLTPDFALLAAGAAGLIGAVTLTGSFIAAGKLQGIPLVDRKPPAGLQVISALLAAATVVLLVLLVLGYMWAFWALLGVAAVLGITLVQPIGGADMPVVISLLNSYSGLAAAAAGFLIDNNVLIIAGSLVGASGLILTNIMCKAMNRSLANVVFGKLEPSADGPSADEVYEGKIKATSPEEVAMLLDGVQRVAIVPGYGMAVAQCQHSVRELADELASRGVTVEYAIHPVAGRMPGHMNVLLAEADVPYDQLKTMEEMNPHFSQVDVVIVLGANDVVNPVANTDPTSPIAGMPILEVDKARTVVVIKRSLSPGFAGIPNPLFAADNCLMLFGDGKQAMVDLVAAVIES